jgi:hypothetical protein
VFLPRFNESFASHSFFSSYESFVSANIANTLFMARNFLADYFNESSGLGIGFRRKRHGQSGLYLDGTLVSRFEIPDPYDELKFNYSYKTMDGYDFLVALSPAWSSCTAFQSEDECIRNSTGDCGWCSIFEDCMKGMNFL